MRVPLRSMMLAGIPLIQPFSHQLMVKGAMLRRLRSSVQRTTPFHTLKACHSVTRLKMCEARHVDLWNLNRNMELGASNSFERMMASYMPSM